MRSLLVVPVALLVLLVGVPLLTHRDNTRRGLALRRAALGWAAVVVLFTTAFGAGESMTDPGGAAGVGLALAVVLPVVALVLLALLRPGWAAPLLVVLTPIAAAGAVWLAFAGSGLRAWQDDHGPVLAVAVFVVGAGASALGWHRPGLAAALLLVLGLLPLLAQALADRRENLLGASTAWLTVPAAVTGVVYLVAALMGGPLRGGTGAAGPGPSAGDEGEPDRAQVRPSEVPR
ncbi:MAG: hypothetical protein ACTHOD_12255 [Motilibacteraceae bacterium]